MSQSPAPRSNFVQLALFALLFFFVLQIFTQGNRATPDPRTSTEMLVELRIANSRLLDSTAHALYSRYEQKLQQEARDGKLTEPQLQAKLAEGLVLVVDAQLKSGLQRDSTGKLTAAYFALEAKQRAWQSEPFWREPVAIPAPENPASSQQFSWRAWTPATLYDRVVEELNVRYQREPVWGLFNGYAFIDFLVALTGRQPAFSYAFAGLLLATVVKLVVWPLVKRQILFSRRMMQLKPLMDELREKYVGKGKPPMASTPEYQQKTMELYKEYGVNPVAGCVPVLLQMPLFLLIYQCMLHYRFEFKKGTFLWIDPGVAQATNHLVASSLGETDRLLVVIYGISMVVTTLFMPISDPANARTQRLMGIGISVFFTIGMFFWPIPSAFVLYWTFTNIIGTAQTLYLYRQPMPPLVKVNAPHGAVYPVTNGAAGTGHTNDANNGKLFGKTGTPKRSGRAGKNPLKARKRKK